MRYIKKFKKNPDDYLEITIPEWYSLNNCNNALLSVFLSYGNCNGYSREFQFTLLCPWNWGIGKSSHNGHGRAYFACGLFSFYFDFLDKKSIVFSSGNSKN